MFDSLNPDKCIDKSYADGIVTLLNNLSPPRRQIFVGKLSPVVLLTLSRIAKDDPSLTALFRQRAWSLFTNHAIDQEKYQEIIGQNQDSKKPVNLKLIATIFKDLVSENKKEIKNDLKSLTSDEIKSLRSKNQELHQTITLLSKQYRFPIYKNGFLKNKKASEQVETLGKISLAIRELKNNREANESKTKNLSTILLIEKAKEKVEAVVANLFRPDVRGYIKKKGFEKATADPNKTTTICSPRIIESKPRLMDELIQETQIKVKEEMPFSNSFFGMTIGELVKKHGGEEKYYLGSAGESYCADAIERMALQEMMRSATDLTAEEKAKLKYYLNAIEKGFAINQAIEAYCSRVENFKPQDIEDLAKIPFEISEVLFNKTQNLKDEEGIFLHFSHYNHAMKIAIQKKKDHYCLTLYDSSGGLEVALLSESGIIAKTLTPKIAARKGFQIHPGLSIEVPSKVFAEKGRKYLEGLIERTAIGIEDQRLQDPIAKTLDEIKTKIQILPKSQFLTKWYLQLKKKKIELLESFSLWKNKYQTTLQIFTSIAPNSAKIISEMQGVQWIGNCTAKRIKSLQIKELGYPLYQKANARIHEFTKQTLLEQCKQRGFIEEQNYQNLLQSKPMAMSFKSIEEASTILSKYETFPPHSQHPLSEEQIKENQMAIRYVIALINHNLHHLQIPGRIIRTKNDSLPKASELELSKLPSMADLQQVSLVKRFRIDRSAKRVVEMNIGGARREISKSQYFKFIQQDEDYFYDKDIMTNVLFLAKDKRMTSQERLLLNKIFSIQLQRLPKEIDVLIKKSINELEIKINRLINTIEDLKNQNDDQIISQKIVELEKVGSSLEELRDLEDHLSKYMPSSKELKNTRHAPFVINTYFYVRERIDELISGSVKLTV